MTFDQFSQNTQKSGAQKQGILSVCHKCTTKRYRLLYAGNPVTPYEIHFRPSAS